MREYRLIIIGGGPAGLSAALGAKSKGIDDILIVDRSESPGGLLRQCIHTGFGMRRFGEDLAGPEYAERLVSLVDAAGIELVTDTSAIGLSSDRTVTLAGKGGVTRLRAEALIMASGCRERSIGSLPVSGTRPAGVFPAGSVQKMINLGGHSVGERAVVLGSGDVGLIAARRLTLEGKKVLAVVEKEKTCGGLARNRLLCLDAFGIPLLTGRTVSVLYGRERLTGVRISSADEGSGAGGYDLECDTLVTSLGLIPEVDLLRELGVRPENGSVPVNGALQTGLPWLFVCGNARRVRSLADDVADDGALAGESAAEYILKKAPSVAFSGFAPDETVPPAKNEIRCLFCPRECALTISDGAVRGGLCPQGDVYASRELQAVRCPLTSTVKTAGGKRLPVRTRGPVAVGSFRDIMSVLGGVTVRGSVRLGQIIVPDAAGAGADVVASMTMD